MSATQPVLSIFADLDDLLAAIGALRLKGVEIGDVHSPTFQEEIQTALAIPRSPVRFFTLTGGILGILSGFGLAIYTAMQWHFIVSGKPPVPRVPYVIEAFEFCILFSVLCNLGGMLFLARLPKHKLPAHYDPRCTEDRYTMLIHCPPADRAEIGQLLREMGAEEVNDLG
jgi:molybdopterin-containing oxidoreductase family membrane subunit